MSDIKYKRVLIKLSGEALAAAGGFGFDFDLAARVCDKIKQCAQLGVQIAIVVGAGNLWRGRQGGDMDRSAADQMGMLATMINCLALKETFRSIGCRAEVLSASFMPQYAEPYTKSKACEYLDDGRIVIFGCGTGNPYFTTDTAAALKAAEIEADIALFAKNIDGVYDSDPKQNAGAKRFSHLSYTDLLSKHLKVIDATAAALCEDNDMPVLIFELGDGSNIVKAVTGKDIGTVLNNKKQSGGTL